MRTPPELPAHLPPVPEGCVYLGRGGTFEAPRTFGGYATSAWDKTWAEEPNWAGNEETYRYAAPADSEIVRLNFGPQDSVKDELLAALKGLLPIAEQLVNDAHDAGTSEFPAGNIAELLAAKAAILKAEAQ